MDSTIQATQLIYHDEPQNTKHELITLENVCSMSLESNLIRKHNTFIVGTGFTILEDSECVFVVHPFSEWSDEIPSVIRFFPIQDLPRLYRFTTYQKGLHQKYKLDLQRRYPVARWYVEKGIDPHARLSSNELLRIVKELKYHIAQEKRANTYQQWYLILTAHMEKLGKLNTTIHWELVKQDWFAYYVTSPV